MTTEKLSISLVKTIGLVLLATASNASIAAGDCWVEVYDQADFAGAHVRIQGPAELPNLAKLGGANWSNRIESVEVGPKAQVLAFRQEDYKDDVAAMPYHGDAIKAWHEDPKSYSDKEIAFGAGAREHHLGELNFHRNINSLKVKCLP